MQSLEGDELAQTFGDFETELSANEARVLHSLVKWPNLSDQAIHSRINMKKSTFSSIKTRLKEQNYYDRYYVPNFPKIGFELFSVFFGKLNRYTTTEERMRIARDLLESFVEDFYIASENNIAFNLSVCENLTEHEKNLERFFEVYIINNFLSRRGMDTIYYPFEVSDIFSFMDYETIIAKIFGFQSEPYKERMTIPNGPVKTFKLTRAERKVLVGLIEYPEESDTLIAEKIGVSRNTVANAKRKFLKKQITFPRVVPNLHELGLKFLNFSYYKFSPKINKEKKAEIAENVRKIMSPHFFITKALDGVSVSAHIDEKHYKEVQGEVSDYLMKDDILLESPTSYQLDINNINIIKQYDFLPMIMKKLGFDGSTPIADQ